MKHMKLFVLMVSFAILLFTGCNPVDIVEESEDVVALEEGTAVEVPANGVGDFDVPASTRAGSDWAGWYSACLSFNGVYNVYVYPYYSSPYYYCRVYMCNENHQYYYYAYSYNNYEVTPYANYQFSYTYSGDNYTVKFELYNGQKRVKISNNSEGYWTRYSKD
ncbi:MAG: hypothetical protein JXB88_03545 [Spirochaetales bacterium]|nr:hypothetical protein [Spirochaetales bacterium]